MNCIIENADILYASGKGERNVFFAYEDDKITYIGKTKPQGKYDRVIDGKGRLIVPGFYNCHCHAAMTLLRGIGEDLPLDRWLNEKIFPAEDKLTKEAVRVGSDIACMEMIRNGIVSFSDMYYFSEETVKSAAAAGIRANVSRGVVSFDENADKKDDKRFNEAIALYEKYHNSGDGRIKIDMAIHAEYTMTEKAARYVSEYAAEHGLNMQLHLSETRKEHSEAIARRGLTPAGFFAYTGAFNTSTTAAHCVAIDDNDIGILKKYNVSAAHNPASNLKLGSGIMKLRKLLDAGINVTLGTDGAASNNNLDIMKEANLAVLLAKGISNDPQSVKSEDMLPIMTVNGAKAQGRGNCGELEIGYKADFVLLDEEDIGVLPMYDICDSFIYNMTSRNIRMTVCDGKTLYNNGEYYTVDSEKTIYGFKKHIKDFI